MKRNFTYLFIILFTVMLPACSGGGEEEHKIPATVLSKEKYVKLLVDFSLGESAANLNIKNLSGLNFDSTYAFNPLKDNNVSQALYDSTISFYSKHPKIYKQIFEEVLASLSKMQATRNSIKKDSVVKKDSAIKTLIKKDTVIRKNELLKKETLSKNDSVTKKIKKEKKSRRKKKKKTA